MSFSFLLFCCCFLFFNTKILNLFLWFLVKIPTPIYLNDFIYYLHKIWKKNETNSLNFRINYNNVYTLLWKIKCIYLYKNNNKYWIFHHELCRLKTRWKCLEALFPTSTYFKVQDFLSLPSLSAGVIRKFRGARNDFVYWIFVVVCTEYLLRTRHPNAAPSRKRWTKNEKLK